MVPAGKSSYSRSIFSRFRGKIGEGFIPGSLENYGNIFWNQTFVVKSLQLLFRLTDSCACEKLTDCEKNGWLLKRKSGYSRYFFFFSFSLPSKFRFFLSWCGNLSAANLN